MTFDLTQDKVAYNQRVSVIAAGVSIGCCLLVLAFSLWVWSVRSARGFLDRISFRLLLWSMFFEIIYGINYIAVVESASPAVINGKIDSGANARCSTGIYFMISTLGIVNYLFTAIAVNLAITIVLGLNPIVLKLERWYVGVSLFIGFFVPIVPAALGHFGFDPIFHVCWIQADSQVTRMTYFVLDLYLWQLLSCFVATFCVAATLIKLFRQGRATSRALFGGNGINLSFSDNSWDLHEEKPRERGLISRFFHRRRHSHDKEHMFGHLEDRFIRIALRISLYPISLIIVNGIIAIGDLYISSQGGVKNSAVYGLYRLYYFLYGARGIVFAMLGLFVDPCLPRGLKQAWKVTFPRGNSSSSESFDLHLHPKPMTSSARAEGCLTPTATRVEQQEMILVNEVAGEAGGPLEVDPTTSAVGAALARQESAGSIDMLHALLMSGPPKDHGHWTHEWHSGAGADGELTEHEDKLRQERHGARAHSFPTFSVARFLRRGSRSRRASTADGKDANADVEKAPAELRIQPPIPEMSPPSTPMALSPRAPGSPGSSASPSSPTSPHVPHTPVLPYSPHSPHSLHSPYSPHSPRLPRSGASTPPAFTMTFAGVAADALPAGFDDHAHDVVHPEALEAAKVAAEKADAEAAAAAAAAASAPPRRPSLAASSTTGVTSAATTQVPSGPFNFAGLLSGFRSSPSPSATPPRRGSLASTGNTAGRRDSLADQGQGGTTPRESRASSRLGTAPRRAGPQPSGEMQLTPIEERRQRRERALEIAERLYEEMEAQL